MPFISKGSQLGWSEIQLDEQEREDGMESFLLSKLRHLRRAKLLDEKGVEEIQDSDGGPGLLDMQQSPYFI